MKKEILLVTNDDILNNDERLSILQKPQRHQILLKGPQIT